MCALLIYIYQLLAGEKEISPIAAKLLSGRTKRRINRLVKWMILPGGPTMYKYKVIATIVEIRGTGSVRMGTKWGTGLSLANVPRVVCVSLLTIPCVRR